MNDLVVLKNGLPVVSSKCVSDKFGKIHRDVLRAIKDLNCSEDFRLRNFAQSSYTSPQNKNLKCVDMTRDGFAFLCMGFTGNKAAKWKEEYIEAFNKMEEYIRRDSGSSSLLDAINETSIHIDLIAEQGSNWGRVGSEIRKNKKDAIERLRDLIDKSQMQLNFKL
jgi:Rha family phage regulatory protein